MTLLGPAQGTKAGTLAEHPSTADLAVVIVSFNSAHWLRRCLPSVFEHAGDAKLDVIVVDNSSTDGSRELVESGFPEARVLSSPNLGFGHANNRAVMACDAPYVLFLNPDTEILEGTFGELVAAMDRQPDVGLAGAIQLGGDGTTGPTVRYFPSLMRSVGEALGSERWPVWARWARERELDVSRYATELECDWTSGSFMLTRRSALLAAGLLDERYFMYCDETDLCLRIKRAGWRIRHFPWMKIVHYSHVGEIRPTMLAQEAYAKRQYARKHFSKAYGSAYLAAVGAGHLLRAICARPPDAAAKREAACLALRTLAGRTPPPFGAPPQTALPCLRMATTHGGSSTPS